MKRGGLPLVFAGLLLMVSGCWARNYNVGDNTGWTQGYDYSDWTSGKSFAVGDVLIFTYTNGAHDVYEINQTAYDSCDFSAPTAMYTSGNDRITLNRTGNWYFGCSYPNHCQNGMKLHVDVLASSAEGPSSSAGGPSGSESSPPPSGKAPRSYSAASAVLLGTFISALAFLIRI